MAGFSKSVLSTAFVAVLACVAAQSPLAQEKLAAQCEEYLPIHKIFSQPNNNYIFSDDREIRADQYSVGGCGMYQDYATGSPFTGNYTLMGHEADVTNKECLIEDNIYNSFQAIVVRANGFQFEANSIDLDDIDSEIDVPVANAWRESMAVFAKSGDDYILPTVEFHDGSLLTSKRYTVSSAAMKEMGFRSGSLEVPGGEYGADYLYNCPFGRQNEDSKKCRMTVKFSQPMDTLVILYAVSKKSAIDKNAAVFFSEILLKCGCRCTDAPASAETMVPVPNTEGECYKSVTTRPRVKCDLLGKKFCSHEVNDYWAKTQQNALPNGNFKCALKASKITRVVSEFAPVTPFLRVP